MSTAQPISEDPVKVDPSHYKVELEKDRVRVLRINYGPRERSVMHGHPCERRSLHGPWQVSWKFGPEIDC
jgi:hypothetical protein